MTMITPSYLGETIEYSSLHACRSTLEDPTRGLGVGRRANTHRGADNLPHVLRNGRVLGGRRLIRRWPILTCAGLIPRPRWRLRCLISSGWILLLRLEPEHSGRHHKANCPFAKVHVSVLSSPEVVTPCPPGALRGSRALVTMPARLFCDYPMAADGMGSELWRSAGIVGI